jgi:DNA-binding NarL/FixJ family response regulator
MEKLRILLADDHTILRSGLRAMLEHQSDMEVAGEAADGVEAFDLAMSTKPDVVVMDINMPTLDGISTTKRIKARLPKCHVLALTGHCEPQFIGRMVQAGARGYVLKTAAPKELVAAIRAVSQGRFYASPEVTEAALHALGAPPEPTAEMLTPREIQVIRLLAKGQSTRAMARELGISPATIDTHRRNIMDKLGLDSVAALVKFAIREGLCDAVQ